MVLEVIEAFSPFQSEALWSLQAFKKLCLNQENQEHLAFTLE